jgi:hypothetical protein
MRGVRPNGILTAAERHFRETSAAIILLRLNGEPRSTLSQAGRRNERGPQPGASVLQGSTLGPRCQPVFPHGHGIPIGVGGGLLRGVLRGEHAAADLLPPLQEPQPPATPQLGQARKNLVGVGVTSPNGILRTLSIVHACWAFFGSFCPSAMSYLSAKMGAPNLAKARTGGQEAQSRAKLASGFLAIHLGPSEGQVRPEERFLTYVNSPSVR